MVVMVVVVVDFGGSGWDQNSLQMLQMIIEIIIRFVVTTLMLIIRAIKTG